MSVTVRLVGVSLIPKALCTLNLWLTAEIFYACVSDKYIYAPKYSTF